MEEENVKWWHESWTIRIAILEGVVMLLTRLTGDSVLEGLGFTSHAEIIRNWFVLISWAFTGVAIWLRARSNERIRWK